MVWGIIALAFAGAWAYAFYREDIHDREPVWLLAVAFLGGAASMFPALWTENLMLPDGIDLDGSLLSRLGAVFLVAGPVEEFWKFAAVWLLVRPRAHFNEPIDGIIYAVMAATGFATAENLHFMVGDPKVILARGPIAVAIHILFASFWGGALAHAYMLPGRARRFLIITLGVAAAAVVHGLFDAIVFSVDHELTLWQARAAQIVLVLACFAFLRWRIRVALAQSPFRKAAEGAKG
jgi:RsiW-degrading membrane proteinase PrsW (M82 family)